MFSSTNLSVFRPLSVSERHGPGPEGWAEQGDGIKLGFTTLAPAQINDQRERELETHDDGKNSRGEISARISCVPSTAREGKMRTIGRVW